MHAALVIGVIILLTVLAIVIFVQFRHKPLNIIYPPFDVPAGKYASFSSLNNVLYIFIDDGTYFVKPDGSASNINITCTTLGTVGKAVGQNFYFWGNAGGDNTTLEYSVMTPNGCSVISNQVQDVCVFYDNSAVIIMASPNGGAPFVYYSIQNILDNLDPVSNGIPGYPTIYGSSNIISLISVGYITFALFADSQDGIGFGVIVGNNLVTIPTTGLSQVQYIKYIPGDNVLFAFSMNLYTASSFYAEPKSLLNSLNDAFTNTTPVRATTFIAAVLPATNGMLILGSNSKN